MAIKLPRNLHSFRIPGFSLRSDRTL